MRVLLLVAGLFVASHAFAFPDMVRHGYVSCISCHTSMVGGGLLNEYGRSLAREVLSQKSLNGIPVAEGSEAFAYGVVKTPAWLLAGGDVRLLQYFEESKQVSRARFFIMQVDLEGSAQVTTQWRVFASLGRVEPKAANATAKDFVTSSRHGVEYLFTKPDDQKRMAIRLGRFMPAYGINFAEHTFVTRRLLDFQPGYERYGAELSWSGTRNSVIATGIASQADNNGIVEEKGGVVQAAMAWGEQSKLGLNYYQTERKDGAIQYSRRMMGAFAHLSLSKTWYSLIEADRIQGADQKWGFVEIFKLGYELHQGLHLIGAQEFANLNLDESNPKFEAFSVGAEWFPRPHWDLLALYRRERDTALSNDFKDVGWLILHFYL